MKLICKLCGKEFKSLISHIKYKHEISLSDYRSKFGVKCLSIVTDDQKKIMSNSQKKRFLNQNERKKNSEIQKNGSSCFTKKFWINRGMNEVEAENKVSEIQKENARKHIKKLLPEHSHFNIEFWKKRGMSDFDAKSAVRKLQQEMSCRSSKFLGKKSTDERNEKISKSLKRHIEMVGIKTWISHFKIENGVSKAQIEFFENIKKITNLNLESNVSIGNYIVDIIYDNKIIEFNGDFWHANPQFYKEDSIVKIPNTSGVLAKSIWEKDAYKIDSLKDMGYDVMVIWENEWNTQRKICVEKINKYYEITSKKCC